MGGGLGRAGRASCLIPCNVFVEPCLRGEFTVQRCDGNAESICSTAGPGRLSDLVHAIDEVAEGLHLHHQPPHNGVVAIRLKADGMLRDGITVSAAADLIWSVTSSGTWDDLVVTRGWSTAAYRRHIGEVLRLSLVK